MNSPQDEIDPPPIPFNIYQTWYTKDLPPKMQERVDLFKSQNPQFAHYLFDNEDCRQFILTHFNENVLAAFDSLIPGAYKADLWRLCILYINGGVYADIKIACENNFSLIDIIEEEHFVRDSISEYALWNGFMMSKKGNPFLLQAINKIVENVQNKYYGSTALCPTGPLMLGKLHSSTKATLNVDMSLVHRNEFIKRENKTILSTIYPEYRKEQSFHFLRSNQKHYSKAWNERAVYD